MVLVVGLLRLALLASFCLISELYASPVETSAVQRPLCFFVDGLDGSGKTTLIGIIEKQLPSVQVLAEPAEQWFDVFGQGNLWKLYLTDQKRWSFSIETYISFVRLRALEQILATTDKKIVLVDRSLYADRYVFAHFAHENGSMNELEWAMYTHWFEWLLAHSPKPDGLIYLKVAPENVLKRMVMRGRPEEANFPIALLQKFEQYNEEFFIQKKAAPAQVAAIPSLVIDGNSDFKNDAIEQKKCIEAIQQFITQVAGNA